MMVKTAKVKAEMVSKITKYFSQGSTEFSHNIAFGLAPMSKLYSERVLSVDKVKYYSFSFDESYNSIMKKG